MISNIIDKVIGILEFCIALALFLLALGVVWVTIITIETTVEKFVKWLVRFARRLKAKFRKQ